MAATGAQVSEPQPSSLAPKAAPRPSAELVAAAVRDQLGEMWMPRIYRERILPMRTRSHRIPAATKGADVEVQHTLLGIELRVGRRRLSCPDLTTARYLSTFARAGCTEVAVPYDITQISRLADELESSWQRMLLLAEHHTRGRGPSFTTRVRTTVVKEVRGEIERAGAGTPVPQFNQNTKQRPQRNS